MTYPSNVCKVSIIMPAYNRANFIAETIESILRQTYQNWELIIVDDGSDDNTEKVVLQIKDSRIKFYKAGRIAIASKIKNIGLEKATGDVIAFIDSDDLWDKTKLGKQLSALEQYPEAGFSLTGGYNFRELNKPLEYFYKKRDGMRHGNILIAFFESEVAATTPTLMVRKNCVEIIGQFREKKPHTDVDFMLRLAGSFECVILYEPLFYRRLHPANDSSLNWVIRQQEGIAMIGEYKKLLPSRVVAESLFRAHIHFGENYLRHNKNARAIWQFGKAWSQKPLSLIPAKKIAKAILYFFKK